MKLSNKKIKYIRRQVSKKTPEEIAADLRISIKDVQKVLRQSGGKSQNSSTPTPKMKKDSETAYTYHLVAVLAICFLCIIIYSNTLNSPFVFDDHPNIKGNPYLRITTFDLKKLYNAGFKGSSGQRPIAMISFALNYYLGEYDVSGYHIVNILIHIINGILVYFLALILFKQVNDVQNRNASQFPGVSIPLMSLFAALIFITHPVQTQSVTYIVQRMNSMAAMFYLLSLLLYIKGRLARIRWRRWTLFCGCVMSWILALGSKEIAATFPLILLVYEWYFFQDLRLEWLRRNLTFFLGMFAVLGLVVLIYLGKNPFDRILAGYANFDFTMSERVLTQFRVVLLYISLLVCPLPSRLNLLHHITTSSSLIEPITTVFSLLIIVGLMGLAVHLARKQRLISFCIFWFFFNLAIESSIIGLDMIFEHRLYLPLFGFVLIVSYLTYYFLSKRQLWASIILVIMILSLSTATYVRNRVWRDEVALWRDCVEKSPQKARPHNSLGTALNKQGRTEEAIEHYLQALRIKPDFEEAHYNLGNALEKKGRTQEAIEHYLQALRIKPDYVDAHNNLAVAYFRKGNMDGAVTHFREAVRINPDHTGAKDNLKKVLMMQQQNQ